MTEPETKPSYPSGFDQWVITKFRPFAKLWFEFIEALLVVSLFVYLGRKSNNPYVVALSGFTYLLFIAYCLSYVQLWLPIRSHASYRPYRIILNVVIALLTAFVIWRWSNIFPDIMESLINLQSSMPK